MMMIHHVFHSTGSRSYDRLVSSACRLRKAVAPTSTRSTSVRGLSSLATTAGFISRSSSSDPSSNHYSSAFLRPQQQHKVSPTSSFFQLKTCSFLIPASRRHFSSSSSAVKDLPVKILYASQGGTAQIFAMQLSEALEEVPGHENREVTVQSLLDEPPLDILQPGKAFHVFLASTTGVGEPPDNARKFYQWLMSDDAKKDTAATNGLEGLDYCVFGLGNQKAHPNHYNFVGKGLDRRLEELGARRILDLGLGDDGECIEDDYDTWLEGFIQSVYLNDNNTGDDATASITATTTEEVPKEAAAFVEDPDVTLEACQGAKCKGGKRLVSTKYARLQLTPSGTDVVRANLFHLNEGPSPSPFYMPHTEALPVISNRPLNVNAGENGMFEMRVSLEHTNGRMTYETGDHIMVYPQNSQAMVEGFLMQFDVDPHASIEASSSSSSSGSKMYPHPTGITLSETLYHCVDLSAVPPPKFARLLLGRQKIDYKNEIATPRRTVLDLMAEASRPFALEEILYNLPPMKPRYYSIASSNLVHPEEIYMVYRPVAYTSTRGNLRVGVSTSYLKNMMGTEDDGLDDYNSSSTGASSSSHLIAHVNPNPTFRLPKDKKTPVLLIAGGCGIAPIRAFLEERMHLASEHHHNPYGEGYLFLGFRSPGDAPYKNMVQRAFKCGAISNVHLTYTSGCGKGANANLFGNDDVAAHTSCGLVSDAVGEHGEQLYSFFERGGHTYICGGARLFGVAIENQVHQLLQNEGNLSEEESTQYLQRLLAEGRFSEDLSD